MRVPITKKNDARMGPMEAGPNPTRDPEIETEHKRPGLVASERAEGTKPTSSVDIQTDPLFPSHELGEMRSRWDRIQTGFVDEPRNAVQEADDLVAYAMQRLADVFAGERSKLEQQWGTGASVSTEDLRVALQRYRSFFHRVLSV
jgi:hypothetical protein